MHRLRQLVMIAVGCLLVWSAEAVAQDDPIGDQTPAVDAPGTSVATDELAGDVARFVKPIPPLRFKQFNLAIENDAVGMLNFVRPDDSHYTNGISLAFGFDGTWAEGIAQAVPFYDSFARGSTRPVQSALGITVGQMMFTPDERFKSIVEPVPEDRPYNGYLFVGLYAQRATETTLDHLQIDLGVTGQDSKVEAVQEAFHDTFGISNFQGWDNMKGTQFAFQFTLRKKWRWRFFDHPEKSSALEVIPHVGFTVGNVFRNVEGAVLVRYGWNLPDDFGYHRVLDVQSATGGAGDGAAGVYFFGRVGGRIVEHDAMLEGRTFDVDEETFVGDVGFGIVGYFRPWERAQLELGWALTLQSDSFEGQTDSDGWGAYFLRLTWDF